MELETRALRTPYLFVVTRMTTEIVFLAISSNLVLNFMLHQVDVRLQKNKINSVIESEL